MQIIYGKSPNLVERNRSKYSDLWEALRKTNPGEWLAIATSEIKGSTPSAKRNLLLGAAKTAKLSIQVVVETELIFVRLRAKAATETPVVKPETPQAKPLPKPDVVPAPEAPKPAPAQAAPAAMMSGDLAMFLADTTRCAPGWNDIELPDDLATHRPAQRELKRLANIKGLTIETKIEDGCLYCRVKK